MAGVKCGREEMRLAAVAWVQAESGKVQVMIRVNSNTGNFIERLFLNESDFTLIILFMDIYYDDDDDLCHVCSSFYFSVIFMFAT